MPTKEFHELMGIVKYGNDKQKAILLKALLRVKKERKAQKTKKEKGSGGNNA